MVVRGLTSRVVHGSFLNLIGQGVTMLATFIATPFVIRLLGAASYGVLALVHVLIGYLSFADMGMATASTRFGSLAHARGDDEGEATAIWTSLLLAIIPAATVSLALALGARVFVERGLRLPPNLHDAAVICVRLAALGFLARAIAGVMNTPAIVRLRMDISVAILSGTAVAQIAFVPIVIYLGGGLTGGAMVIAAAAILCALLYTIAGVHLLPALRRPHIDREMLRTLAKFGGALVISTIAATLLGNIEKLLVPRYASVQALAYYSVAFTLAFMLTQLPVALTNTLVPAFSQLLERDDRAACEQLYRRGLRGLLFWALAGSVFIAAVARPFFTIWAGPQYGVQSTLPLYLLLGGVACEVLAYVPQGLLIALGRTDIVARCHLSILIPYVVASALLIRACGAPGAAIAWSLRAMVTLILFSTLAERVSGFAFVPLPANKRDFALSVLILVVPVAIGFLISPLVRTIIACVAVASYVLLVFTRVLTTEERAAVQRLW
jgi:O-antigen/teichoic acid export membrane protein